MKINDVNGNFNHSPDSGPNGAAIGSGKIDGNEGSVSHILILNSNITTGSGAYEQCSIGGKVNIIEITNSTVTASGGINAPGIGANFGNDITKISISYSNVSVYGGENGAGIGAYGGKAWNISIYYSRIFFKCGAFAAGIGSSERSRGYDCIEIDRSDVVAKSGGVAGAIGASNIPGTNYQITIRLSTVNASTITNKRPVIGGENGYVTIICSNVEGVANTGNPFGKNMKQKKRQKNLKKK